MKRIKTISRLFEQICGVLGSFLCLTSGSFILLIESGGAQGNSFLAILAIIGAFIGFISSYYVNKSSECWCRVYSSSNTCIDWNTSFG